MPRPRAVVAAALAVAVGTALPLQGRGESARAEVGSASGPLVATDGNGAVLVAQGLRPGHSRAGEVTVVNAGDTSGALTLSQADRVDSPTQAGPLSGVLDLSVADLASGRTVFAGKLGAMPRVALGAFAQGDSHRYRFVVTFPAGAPALDNQFQVASTTVSYVWSAGPVPPAPPSVLPTDSTPVPTLGSTVPRPRPTARLTCGAACRARFTATARASGATARARAVSRTLRRAGGVTVRLALPRRTRTALFAGRKTMVRVSVHVSIAGRNLLIRKTVRLSRKRK
jgi:spore coat-associated protein N